MALENDLGKYRKKRQKIAINWNWKAASEQKIRIREIQISAQTIFLYFILKLESKKFTPQNS